MILLSHFHILPIGGLATSAFSTRPITTTEMRVKSIVYDRSNRKDRILTAALTFRAFLTTTNRPPASKDPTWQRSRFSNLTNLYTSQAARKGDYVMIGRCLLVVVVSACVFLRTSDFCGAESLPLVLNVELQPLAAQVERLAQSLQMLGAPLNEQQQAELDAALATENQVEAIKKIQRVFDQLCLVGVHINPESRVKAYLGPASKHLMQQGWRLFLVKTFNEAGVTSKLRCTSPNAAPIHDGGRAASEPKETFTKRDLVNRWLDVSMAERKPLGERLSGLELEYRVIELFSRDLGKREATLLFDVGQGTQDLGFRSEVNILFDCQPSVEVELEVLDEDGSPTTAGFTFRDSRGRVYPTRSKRLAPDFFFHDQIYRSHGETIRLPPGKYQVAYSRGPEYRILTREIVVPPGAKHQERFRLRRWIHMARLGWISGDHHLHAAGCSHYSSPAQGADPGDMMRHILGEDLNVGCVLTWGPCWYHQKQFFKGGIHPLSTKQHVMRYDVEVSGFPSSPSGHLVLLRLKEDDYPGTKRIEEWPSWNLPILQWAKEQGGVVGFAHSGWGLEVPATSLPTYDLPAYDGIGANEYIVDVTHGACDFISTVDTPAIWELNIWYHTLNCGFTTRISGETDFPCIYGERVGLGRSYVNLPPDASVDFDAWVLGIQQGRSYCSDGQTHLFDFSINDLGVGQQGEEGRASFLAVDQGEPLMIRVKVAAMLEEKPREDFRHLRLDEKPFWHPERARVEKTRQIPVELIVNGEAVEKKLIEADGHIEEISFEYLPTQSSWVALRVFSAAHTNPIFVEIDRQPIRTSKRSAQWCLDSVDRCWKSKRPKIRDSERAQAEIAYDHARNVYRQILAEAFDDRNSSN